MKAVFLDRDGVIVRDAGPVARFEDFNVYPTAPQTIRRLNDAGFLVVVVTNQTVVARGLCSEADVDRAHQQLAGFIFATSGGVIDRFYFCPHHPNATVAAYRAGCACRKPRSGLFERAAHELGVNLARSYAVGDRLSDIAAGARVGCRTILVETGQHTAPAIESAESVAGVRADLVCPDLAAAVQLIVDEAVR